MPINSAQVNADAVIQVIKNNRPNAFDPVDVKTGEKLVVEATGIPTTHELTIEGNTISYDSSPGESQNDVAVAVANLINEDATVREIAIALVDGTELAIESRSPGTAENYTVVSGFSVVDSRTGGTTSVSTESQTQEILEWIFDQIRADLVANLGAIYEANEDAQETITTSFTTISHNNVRTINTNYYIDLAGGQIEIAQAGVYRIDFSNGYEVAGASAEIEGSLALNGSLVAGTETRSQIPANSTGGAASGRVVLELLVGDVLEVRARRVSGSGTVQTIPEACSITITAQAQDTYP